MIVGTLVHYVSKDTCQAAFVTGLYDEEQVTRADLAVFNREMTSIDWHTYVRHSGHHEDATWHTQFECVTPHLPVAGIRPT